jgi:YVTN family beta-propeller protein
VTGRLENAIRVGRLPTGVVAGGGSIWVSNGGETDVWQIDPKTDEVVAKIDTRYYPEGLAYGRGYLWVAVQSEPFTF